ncbi:POTRA domain-containing protein [Shivajiella indica]|uniref:POTRA domain-containing protein n=1 Tax=Shivajiella indica TaxID=872115 RepID=A0ABW5B1T2_9BACT
MKKLLLFFICLSLFLQGPLFAQRGKWVQYEIRGEVLKKESLSFSDSMEIVQFKKELFKNLHQLGYLNPKLTQEELGKDSLFLFVNTGEKFEWVSLSSGNVEPVFLVKAGVDLKQISGKPFNFAEVARIFDNLLKSSENQGYPFASIGLDSVRRTDSKFYASLNLDLGPLIKFDSLNITGKSKTKREFLARFLQIRPGDAFSQKKVNDGIRQIRNLPYLRWAGEPELSFQNEEATLYLPLDDRRVNSIDGIIGFLPNELEGGRMLVTGQFDLALYNVAGKGRNYELHWQRFNQFSQNLNISALEPLLFGSGIDLKASFSLLKEDTTFLTRDFRLDFGYRIGSGSYLRFFSRRQAGDLLAVSGLSEAVELPEVGDFRFNNYGLGFEHSWLDDRFFPRRGAIAGFEFALGNKNILVNTAIPPNLYSNIDLNTLQYYIMGKVEKHFYKNQKWGLMSRVAAGFLDNPNLFVNDLFRLGGLRTIRGFNENFFFANNYIYLNLEPRYYFDTYSYFMIFADMGRLENQVQKLPTDYPYALGAGFSLETGSGIFNFVYALGGSNAQDFALNVSKIHFGYTGRF